MTANDNPYGYLEQHTYLRLYREETRPLYWVVLVVRTFLNFWETDVINYLNIFLLF